MVSVRARCKYDAGLSAGIWSAACSFLGISHSTVAGPWPFAFEFATPTTLSFAGIASPRCTAIGDMDEDGTVDLVIAGNEDIEDPEDGNSVWLLRGVGAGRFAVPEPVLVTAEPSLSIRWLVTAELTGDSHLDLAVVSNQWLWVLRGDGLGNFVLFEHIQTGAGHRQLVAADLDADGDTDLAATDHFGDHAWIRYNDGAGHFPASMSWVIPDAHFIIAADFNGDGLIDLALTEALSDSIKVFPNEGSKSLTFGLALPLQAGGFPYSLAAANLDNDCDFDLVVSNVAGLSISVMLNETSEVQTCAVADLNVDAVVDMGDVAVVVSAWGEGVSPADLNYDGVVNGFDLATVLGHWDPTR